MKHYYFIYKSISDLPIDIRCPVGACTLESGANQDCDAVNAAYDIAERRFPCKTWELIVVIEQFDKVRQQQAALLERCWIEEFFEFRHLMTTPERGVAS